MSDLTERVVNAVRRNLTDRHGILDEVDSDIQIELCGSVVVTVLRVLANSRGTGGLWIHSIADEIEGVSDSESPEEAS